MIFAALHLLCTQIWHVLTRGRCGYTPI